MKLNELTMEIQALYDFATDPEVDEQAFKDTLEGLMGEFQGKAEDMAKLKTYIKGDIATLDAEIKRLKARKESMETRLEKIDQEVTKAIVDSGQTKFKTALYTIWVQNNPPSVVIDKEEDIPFEYYEPQAPKLVKERIKKAIENGEDISFAHLEQTVGWRYR